MLDRVAILSFHAHGDRSFLDDRELSLASGDLKRAGIENDWIAVRAGEAVGTLAALLEPYDAIVYERVSDVSIVRALREALPRAIFVACQGEHRLLDPPADYECRGELRRALVALFRYLRKDREHAPPGTRRFISGRWERIEETAPLDEAPLPYAPNLGPISTALSTFSILGNAGCPYQADARDNPLYRGVRIPEGAGRGCAFCTTGNRYEARAPEVTAQSVLEQIRYVRANAPELEHLVLKDQNPFAWLGDVIDGIGAETLGGFSLLLETRVDWFVRNRARFERALDRAASARVRLAPYLVGIESFSQRELDRFNKGMSAEDNVAFLLDLDRWEASHPESLDLSHASFGFILFTPWTAMEDLRANFAAIVRTGFDRFRGSLLLSRVRLYPDTALYWLAKEHDLLAEHWDHEGADSARRYGYFPGHPWRFADARVAHFSKIAMELSERMESRDQRRLFGALLEVFDEVDDFGAIDAARVTAAIEGQPALPTEGELASRLARLIEPLAIDRPFSGGWHIGELRARPNRLRVALRRGEEAVVLDLEPRSSRESYARSRHYDVRHLGPSLSASARAAVDEFCSALAKNDR